MRRFSLRWPLAAALFLVAAALALRVPTGLAWQEATPSPYACDDATPLAGTPVAGMDDGGMAMGSPVAERELDQAYIDMMIPHHASIVALAEAARPRLTDERLVTLAEAIIAAQTAEIDELRGYREEFYGSPEPAPLDEAAMMRLTPGMTMPMDEMMAQMDAATQVAAFCAAADADLAFIDLTIPHHQSAIAASETALDQATHHRIRDFAQKVIDAQRREIDELSAIRQDLYGSATPEAVATSGHTAHATTPADAATAFGPADGVEIRALTPEEIAQIERGEGAGFALPAELNGVPGPRHVLDLADELGLSGEQIEQVQQIFDAMRSDAILAGERYLAAQRSLEVDFRNGALSEASLSDRAAEMSRLEGEIATVHLAAHLRTAATLTADQIVTYQALRQAA